MSSTGQRHAILILSHNAEATLPELLTAVQCQNDLEQIVASVWIFDDASTDRTVEVARQAWQSAIPLEIVVAPENQGQWPNLNQALRRVQSPSGWVLLLHDDDLVKPLWASRMSAAVARCGPRVATISTSWDTITADGRLEPGEDAPEESPIYFAGSVGVRTTLSRGCWWHISGSAIRLASFPSIGDFDPRFIYCGDWEWVLRCLASGWEALVYPISPLIYRKFTDSISSTAFRENLDITESLQIARMYRPFMSRVSYAAFILRRARALLKRTARRLLNGQPLAASNNLLLTCRVLARLADLPTRTATRPPLPNAQENARCL